MIVQPGLMRHPKFVQLKMGLRLAKSAHGALEVLYALWEHCQLNQKGEFWEGVDGSYVEAVCGWEEEPGTLFSLLKKLRWAHLENGGVRIHQWNENNATLVSAWTNGPKGGRPKKTPQNNRSDNPPVNRSGTDGKPTGKPIEKREKIEGGDGEHTHDFDEIPSLEEILAVCHATQGMPGEITEETGRAFYQHYEHERSPKWTDKFGNRFQWLGKLKKWASTDALKKAAESSTGNKKPTGKPAGFPDPKVTELRDIAAELQWQPDPARKEVLQKRAAELRG